MQRQNTDVNIQQQSKDEDKIMRKLSRKPGEDPCVITLLKFV